MPDEIKSGVQDSLSDKGQTTNTATETTPNETPNLISLKEHEDKVAAVGADWGRKYKTLEKENATLKSQLETNQSLIKDNQDRQAKLEEQISELSKDDPDKLRLTQKLRDLESKEKQLKTDRDEFLKTQESYKDRIAKAEKFEVELLATQIAEDYENGDSARLARIADKLADKSEATIREIADSLWTKKQADKPPEPPKPFSGVTSGGAGKLTFNQIKNMTPDEKVKRNKEILEFFGLAK